ncbi:hypothetical protein EJB05_02548, partial [Eragrostis curvula]
LARDASARAGCRKVDPRGARRASARTLGSPPATRAISLALYSHRRRVPRHSRPRALTPTALLRSRSCSRRSLLSPSPTPTGLLLVLMDPGEQRRMTVVKAAAFVTVIYAWLMTMLRMGGGSSARITYGPLSAMDEERQKNLNKIYNCNDIECVNMLRMRRAPFFNLCNLLRSRNLLRDSINSCVEEQVAMFLHVVGHNQRFRVIHTNWRRSIETVSRYFREVLYAIGELREEMIRPPGNETHSRIRTSPRWYPYFKDCIGAIDGTHVHARVPAKIAAAFRGRKHYTTQNVLAAVDFDLYFTYVLAGWEGSAHDALILVDAIEREDGLRVPPGKFYLVDAGYACRPGFLPPYRATRYHLQEYGGRNYPTNAKELFNLRHSGLRVSVERAFGALKGRFRILDNKPFHPYKTQVKLVLACCILHNWILRHGKDEVFPEEATWEPNTEGISGSHALPSEDNAAWGSRRDEIANQMWNNRGTSRGMADIFGNAGSDAPAAAEIVGSEAAPVEVVGDVPAAGDVGAGEARGRGAMRWTSAMSGFVLRRMCQLISTGVRTDKGFKEVHLNQVAKALQEFSGNDVTGTQVYNHLRKWRQRWMKVSKLRELSGANWDEDLCMISLEEEHYKGHIKAHPKDAEYLNKPIENYKQMEMIFGTGLATGKYAMGSNEPLGNPIADSGSAIKIESIDDKAARVIDDIAGLMSEAAKDAKEATSSATPAAPGTKRKRCALSEEDNVALSSMTDAVKDVAAAIRETKVEVLNPDLYGSVMYMAGFTEEALICAFSHLVDNKAQGDAFVKMTEAHRVLWLRTFLAKHYYI